MNCRFSSSNEKDAFPGSCWPVLTFHTDRCSEITLDFATFGVLEYRERSCEYQRLGIGVVSPLPPLFKWISAQQE